MDSAKEGEQEFTKAGIHETKNQSKSCPSSAISTIPFHGSRERNVVGNPFPVGSRDICVGRLSRVASEKRRLGSRDNSVRVWMRVAMQEAGGEPIPSGFP